MKFKLLIFLFISNILILFADENNVYFSPSSLHESKNILLLVDPDTGNIIGSSQGANDYYGYDNFLGINIAQINTLTPQEIKTEMQNAASEKRNYFHFKHKLKNGKIRHVYVTSYPVQKDNKTVLLSGIVDVTTELQKEFILQLLKYLLIFSFFFTSLITLILLKKIKESEKRYSSLFKNMTEAFILYEMDFDNKGNPVNYRCVKANPYFEKLTKIKSSDIEGKYISEILPKFEDSIVEKLDKVAKTGKPATFQHYSKDRNRFYNYHVFSPSKNKFALIFTDVTEQERLKIKLEFKKNRAEDMATHDYLTKLPNRALLKDRIENSLSIALRNKSNIALCMIDLDDFKQINDTYGHLVGDMVLKQIATRIKNALRDFDTLSRFGGDEFVCLLTNFKNKEDCQSIIERILALSLQVIEIDNLRIKPSFSVGISLFPDNGTTYSELIENADKALYSAKKRGKNCYCFYHKFCVDSDKL